MQIAQKTKETPRPAGIGLVALLIQKTVETHHAMREGRAVAALHLTC